MGLGLCFEHDVVVDSWYRTRRERRLWLTAGAAIAAIFSTLVLANTLADLVANRELVDGLFMWGLALLVFTTLGFARQLQRGSREVALLVGLGAVAWFVILRAASPAERSHLAEYGVVALLVLEALVERGSRRPRVGAFVSTSLVGVVDEVVQLAVPGRRFDPADIVTNAVAAALAVGAWSLIRALPPNRRSRAAGEGSGERVG